MKKIAFIGAGSLQFTSSCVRDLLTFPAFRETEFRLMDTNEANLRGIMVIVSRNSMISRYFDTISMILCQIFYKNLD